MFRSNTMLATAALFALAAVSSPSQQIGPGTRRTVAGKRLDVENPNTTRKQKSSALKRLLRK
jgi:hypothetical protein